MTTATATEKNVGTIVQVIGPVLDVEFQPDHLPEIYSALLVEDSSGPLPVRLVAEVQQHIGPHPGRPAAGRYTGGGCRGMQAVDTGGPITVPVGAAALGRILNVLGDPVDGGPPIPPGDERWVIPPPAP